MEKTHLCLLKHDDSGGYSKVPLLGDIPILGNLFRYKNDSMEKDNLMIFIKPIILNNLADDLKVTRQRYQYMRYQQQSFADGLRLNDHSKVNPVLPGPNKVDGSGGIPSPFGQ